MTTAVSSRSARGEAFVLLARLLGEDTAPLAEGATLDALRDALVQSGDERTLARLDGIDAVAPLTAAELAGRWVQWFDLGRVPPYEASNVPASAGGITPRLADIAGFYRAFGFSVTGNRPDHVVAELEFLGMLLIIEADAVERGEGERAEVAGGAARSFIRDHLGGWLEAWAARVGAIGDLAPWAPIASAAAELVRAEAADRRVIALRPAAVLTADAGVADPSEGWLECGNDDPFDG
jgi:hypothetical protein